MSAPTSPWPPSTHSAEVTPGRRSFLGVSDRDRRILARARHKLSACRVDFEEALRALREAVEESIPNGRTFLIGTGATGPIVGSIISGVGIAANAGGVIVVRVG